MNSIDAILTVSTTPTHTIIAISGELDDFQAPKLHAAFQELNAKNERRLIVDLQNTRFVDSVGLGVIVSQAKLVRKANGLFALISASPQITRLVTQSGILHSKHLAIQLFDKLEDAIEAFNGAE
jgi:anti-sigma B factor antagonist